MKGLEDEDEVIKKENIFVDKDGTKRVPDGHTKEYIDMDLLEEQFDLNPPPPTEKEKNLTQKDRRIRGMHVEKAEIELDKKPGMPLDMTKWLPPCGGSATVFQGPIPCPNDFEGHY